MYNLARMYKQNVLNWNMSWTIRFELSERTERTSEWTRTQSKHALLLLYHLAGYALYHNSFWFIWCNNSYWLIFDAVIVSKSVHKMMVDTYLRLYLTHADLQINVCVNIKSLTVNLLQVFIIYYLCVGIFL